VDVTPPETVQTDWGPKDKFKLVFEVEELRDDGNRFAVWSMGFTTSLNEKANFRRFIKQWYGRDLNAQELKEFDTEALIGRPAFLVVTHSEGNNGETYANIAAITPHKESHGEPLQASGKFTRKKDREPREGDAPEGARASYRKAEQPADPKTGEAAGREDWMTTEVHVGKHAGVQLGDLDADAVEKLLTHWLPSYATMDKPRAADKRLAAALELAKAALEGATTEEADY
jgi:hypothetical protein